MRELNVVLGMWGRDSNLDHSQAEKVLGIEFQSVTQGIYDMIYSLIDAGIIPDKRKK